MRGPLHATPTLAHSGNANGRYASLPIQPRRCPRDGFSLREGIFPSAPSRARATIITLSTQVSQQLDSTTNALLVVCLLLKKTPWTPKCLCKFQQNFATEKTPLKFLPANLNTTDSDIILSIEFNTTDSDIILSIDSMAVLWVKRRLRKVLHSAEKTYFVIKIARYFRNYKLPSIPRRFVQLASRSLVLTGGIAFCPDARIARLF
mmetsp:Transcript_6883/g.15422  ORF Transcript_6883/g.15422 Transcript_6883/m.15422 type:complete len:205 (-) Transcript_6883:2951-3565(-)